MRCNVAVVTPVDWTPVFLSLKTAAAATAISFLLGIFAGRWRLTMRQGAGIFLDGVLMLPLALPPTVVGLGLLLLFGRGSPVGELLGRFGASIVFTWPAAVIAATVMALPIMYQSTRAAFAQLDTCLLDTARIFGFSEMRLLWQVMLPLAWPGVAAGTVLTFLRALGEFGATLMIAGNIPGKTQTVPMAIFFAAEAGERHAPLIWATVVCIIAISVICAVNQLSRRFDQ